MLKDDEIKKIIEIYSDIENIELVKMFNIKIEIIHYFFLYFL